MSGVRSAFRHLRTDPRLSGADRHDGSARDRPGRGAHRGCRRQGQEPARPGGARRPRPADRGAARRLFRPALPALLRRAFVRRRRGARLRRRQRRGRPDEHALPERGDDRLRRHHRASGLHHRQPERHRLLRLRGLVPLGPRQAARRTCIHSAIVNIAVTGSIATDHLLTFSGRFGGSLVVDQLDKISLSFLADDLQVRRGGIGANISFGMANLGLEPILIGAVGEDFADYRSWLERHGIDCASVHASQVRHTARFVCTTDDDHAQIATFYAGAMSEAREIELRPIADRVGSLDLVMISPNDPEAMLRHTDEARVRSFPFAADPSQQLAWMDGASIRHLVNGASYLFSNEYEAALLEQKTGWSATEVLQRVGARITTLGKKGSLIEREGEPPVRVPAAG